MLEIRRGQRRLAVSLSILGCIIWGSALPACGGEPEATKVVPEVVNRFPDEIPAPAPPANREALALPEQPVELVAPAEAPPPVNLEEAAQPQQAASAKIDTIGLPVQAVDLRSSPAGM